MLAGSFLYFCQASSSTYSFVSLVDIVDDVGAAGVGIKDKLDIHI